ncbi:HAMP domain-containing sensor histidine kinase [Anaerocolumna sp. AGMB13020]|uniref:sensor histidine kinase n=1 Tax=Anaerocolumna sp. AGMB13020 TaxID=3081750 RepID=UPI0029550BB5|nr:HAMP domain-containing sensor histidine kinase [Anaerocolumna sp. AGMB13020]WOO35430.1 HAMP domain-containing sensor histidine kinase [Anaerocolumna sp. AGMB13020]
MKNSIFKSFRFEIVLYSLLSLVYALLTEAVIFFGIYIVYYMTGGKTDVPGDLQGGASLGSNSNLIQNNSLYNRYTAEQISPTLEGGATKGMIAMVTVIAIAIGIILFMGYFLLLTRKFAVYIERIAGGITAISSGNFDTRITIDNDDEFALIADRINQMGGDIRRIIENERKSENTKNQLITSVAHDLRTPLTSIIGYLDLVQGENNINMEVKKHYVEIAYTKSKRLEKLIEDLFAYTKFSSGEVTLEAGPIDMVKFVEQLAEEFYPSFQESNLQYEFRANTPSVSVWGDGNLLARAFANLIDNAIKYGKDGKSVQIEILEHLDTVQISVINYGKLIPEKDIEAIFERFYRLEESRSSETGGTGLGLAIVKNIIVMHGGSISARSDHDGTVFMIILPKADILPKTEEVKG